MIASLRHFSAGLILCLIFIAGFTAQTNAQTSAFTYQGRLTDGALAASGSYDFQFSLFDSVAGNGQIGLTIPVNGVQVTNGIFTVNLDFGAANLTGADRFLQIAVKKPAETVFTILQPRQQLTSSPYAVKTLSATTADGLSNLCVGCVDNAKIASVAGSKVTGAVASANNSAQLGGVAANQFVQTNDARLTNTRIPTDGSVTTAKFAATPHCRARQIAAQSFTSGVFAVVRLDDTQFCSGVTFDNANDRLVIVTPGVYVVSAEVIWQTNATGLRGLSLFTSAGEQAATFIQTVANVESVPTAATIVRFNAGDIVRIEGVQVSSGNLSTSVFGGRSASLAVAWVGP